MSETTSHVVPARVVRVILVVAVLLEALVCSGFAVFQVAAIGRAADREGAVFLTLAGLILAVALLIAARAAHRARRAARAPILVWQLLQLSVANLTFGEPWWPFGIFLAVLAVVSVVASLWPGVLGGDAGDSSDD